MIIIKNILYLIYFFRYSIMSFLSWVLALEYAFDKQPDFFVIFSVIAIILDKIQKYEIFIINFRKNIDKNK